MHSLPQPFAGSAGQHHRSRYVASATHRSRRPMPACNAINPASKRYT